MRMRLEQNLKRREKRTERLREIKLIDESLKAIDGYNVLRNYR